MDIASEFRLQTVSPALAAKVELLDKMFQEKSGWTDHLEVVQGLRNFADQAALYAKGRTEPGSIVTDAPPGHSWHEFGLAVDCVPRSLLGVPNWKPESPLWALITDLAQKCGLVCGSCWMHKDLPHYQLTGKFPVSPNDEVRALYKQGGLLAVWGSAGINDGRISVEA